jgi:hypothetical protein
MTTAYAEEKGQHSQDDTRPSQDKAISMHENKQTKQFTTQKKHNRILSFHQVSSSLALPLQALSLSVPLLLQLPLPLPLP